MRFSINNLILDYITKDPTCYNEDRRALSHFFRILACYNFANSPSQLKAGSGPFNFGPLSKRCKRAYDRLLTRMRYTEIIC